ncbi:MAG: hypothetical protein WCG42_09740 [Parachlamydiaceae bacterium]
MAKIQYFYYLTGVAALTVALTACGKRQNQDVVDQTYFHKYGVAVPSEYWQSSGEDGAVVSRMADGVVVSRSYAGGKYDGETSFTYPHSSQVQKSEVYQQGNLVKETEFFFDGTPKIETKYDFPESGMQTISTWYLSGTPRNIEQYQGDSLVNGEYFTSLNQRDAVVEGSQGVRLMRDDYGQLLSTDTVQNGQMTLRITYYPNGSPRETISYRNGLAEGTKRTFNPAGDPCSVEQWSNGMQNGATVLFQHGEKCAEIPYVNGDKHGTEVRYRDGQIKVQEIGWNCGKMHGSCTSYIGDVVKTDWYYKGEQTTKADYDYMTGKPAVR